MKVLMVNDPTYTLTLNVEKPKLGSLKKVTVSGFKLESESIFGDSTAVSAAYKNFVIENLQASLQKELEQRLNTNFDVNNLVEINGKLVKGLLLNVFKATAQDF